MFRTRSLVGFRILTGLLVFASVIAVGPTLGRTDAGALQPSLLVDARIESSVVGAPSQVPVGQVFTIRIDTAVTLTGDFDVFVVVVVSAVDPESAGCVPLGPRSVGELAFVERGRTTSIGVEMQFLCTRSGALTLNFLSGAAVAAPFVDSDPRNNLDETSADLISVGQADISVDQAELSCPAAAIAHESFTCTLSARVRNLGPANAASVRRTYTLPGLPGDCDLISTVVQAGQAVFTINCTDIDVGGPGPTGPNNHDFVGQVAADVDNDPSVVDPNPSNNHATAMEDVRIGANTATCSGQVATIVGTAGDDELIGTAGDDVIVGLAGRDLIRGMGGHDVICGGDHRDRIYGNGGDDWIDGGAGNDFISGNRGADVINGGSGNDLLKGSSGEDTLSGGVGHDRIFAGGGNDTASGDTGNDVIAGNNGTDTCDGGPGENTIRSCEI